MKRFQNIAILAGGTSSRFWPLGDKNLLTFAGTSLLKRQLVRFLPFSEKVFVVASGANYHAVADCAHEVNKDIVVVTQKVNGQDKAVQALQGKINGEVVLINGNDVFNDTILEELSNTANKLDCDIVLVAKHMDTYFPGGYIRHEGDVVTDIIEKPAPDATPSSFVKLVVDYIRDFDDFLHVFSGKIRGDDGYEKALSKYRNSGKKILFIRYDGPWETLKYPWQVLSMSHYFLSRLGNHIGKNVNIHKSAIIEGNVYIEDGVTIGEFIKITGPAYIGKNTIVGTHAMIRESMIGAHSLIGAYSEVTRSYLGESVSLHRNYVGDSVFENNILVGGEAVFANFRFDEKTIGSYIKGKIVDTGRTKLGVIVGSNTKIGVNASIMPGVKIGSGLHIGPHQLIKRDCS